MLSLTAPLTRDALYKGDKCSAVAEMGGRLATINMGG